MAGGFLRPCSNTAVTNNMFMNVGLLAIRRIFREKKKNNIASLGFVS